MMEFSLPYFGEIDSTELDEYNDVDVNLKGNTVSIDLNFEKSVTTRDEIETIKDFLENINGFDKQNESYIYNDFKKGGEALNYITFYFEEFDQDELSEIFGCNKLVASNEKQILNKLKLTRVGIYPDHNSECYGVFDYSIDIDGEPCNQLLVVKTDEKGNLDHITWES